MGNDLVGDTGCITANPRGVKGNGSVEALWTLR